MDGWGNVYKRKYLVAVQMKKAERILGTWVNLKTVLKKEKEVKTAGKTEHLYEFLKFQDNPRVVNI